MGETGDRSIIGRHILWHMHDAWGFGWGAPFSFTSRYLYPLSFPEVPSLFDERRNRKTQRPHKRRRLEKRAAERRRRRLQFQVAEMLFEKAGKELEGEKNTFATTSIGSNQDAALIDIASDIGLKVGAQIEVKWTIIIEEGDPQNEIYNDIDEVFEDEDAMDRIKETLKTVWWPATVRRRTSKTFLSDDNKLLPVYELIYDELEYKGYEFESREFAAFLSKETLLNLNPEKVMCYRTCEQDNSSENIDTEDDTDVSEAGSEKASEDSKMRGNVTWEIEAAEVHLNLAQKAKARSSANRVAAEADLEDAEAALTIARDALASARAAFKAARKARKNSRSARDIAVSEDNEATEDLNNAKTALQSALESQRAVCNMGTDEEGDEEGDDMASKKQRADFEISSLVVRRPTSEMSVITYKGWW